MNGFLYWQRPSNDHVLRCYNCRSQLLLPFIPVYYMAVHLKFTSIKHYFHKISWEQISRYGIILSVNSWHPGLKMNDDRPEANHFHHSTFMATVKIFRQKHINDPVEILLHGAKSCKWYIYIYNHWDKIETVYSNPIVYACF